MISAPIPANEKERLTKLKEYNILDTPAEESFEEIVKLASIICKVPMSTITLLDEKRQWFKSRIGIKNQETSREIAFCAHVINGDDLMIVNDATEDERFADNPMVTSDPDIRFYAGMPLITPDGNKLGTICVIDNVPRTLTDDQKFALQILAKNVMTLLELRLKNNNLSDTLTTLYSQSNEIERINNINTRLLSILAHDLKNPLGVIQQVTDMYLAGQISSDDMTEIFTELKKNVKNALDMLNEVLQWGTAQVEGRATDFQEFNIYDLIEQKQESYYLLLKSKGNRLVNLCEKELNFKADLNMMRFILRNLIMNANKFTKDGTISVQTFDSDDFVEIVVSDTGVGMKPSQINRLFQWETRQSSDGTSGEKGTGLGLLICNEFVHKQGGKIWVESSLGRGSKFHFTISKHLK
ncbi:MAG: GAF domain-containing sensor histidine kinase [Ignavibacteria bacterium]|nr:GAF domain-containing sensor histidine kinase [Ignavibacteria bacterium]